MTLRPYQDCPGNCGEYTRGGRCPECEAKLGKAQRGRRTQDKRYNLARWQKTRRAYGAKNPLCEVCLGKGITKVKDLVHHIVPIADGGDWYRWDNLMSLCTACHGIIHGKEHKDDGMV